jgi:hypothetical protein
MKRQILFLVGIVLFVQNGFSQIFSNPITGTNPNTANPYTTGQTVDPNMTASGIGRGTGISGNNANDRYNASGWNTTGSIDLNDYFTFTLTPNTNKNIDLASFTYVSQASGSGPTQFAMRSSVDGFTTNIGAPTVTGTTIDLSGAQFQDVSGPIEFRIYGWSANAAAGTFSINSFEFAGVLPVTLIAFEVTTDQKTAGLRFSTAIEQNNDHFEIERSTDGSLFKKIGEVKGAGNSFTVQHYTYEDLNPQQGTNYYRLRQVDFDGQFTFSPVRSVVLGRTRNVLLFPTPTAETMRIQLEKPFASDAQWQIFDVMGRVVSEGIFPAEQTLFTVSVVTLTEGTYVLRLAAGNEIETKQFRKL